MGKGSGRRPQQISDSEMQDRWNAAFKPKKLINPSPSPRYDDVYHEGVAVLDELAGNGTTYEEASNVNDEMKLHQEKHKLEGV